MRQKKETTPTFSRGYGSVREKFAKGAKYIMSCTNCYHYYKGVGDEEEVCNNSDVLSYDMTVDHENNRVYCIKWQPMK